MYFDISVLSVTHVYNLRVCRHQYAGARHQQERDGHGQSTAARLSRERQRWVLQRYSFGYEQVARKRVKSAVSFLSRLLNPSNSSAKFFLLPYSLLHEQIDRTHGWCSLWRKLNGDRESLLTAWPLDRPENWLGWVNEAQTDAELEALRKCVNRSTPYGSENWTAQIAAALGLKYTLQARGRPRKVVGLTDTQM